VLKAGADFAEKPGPTAEDRGRYPLYPVRLTSNEVAAIREVFEREVGHLGAARLWLFGSRTNPAARGGDIDLYVEIDAEVDNPPALVRRLRRGLEDHLGERRIDIVIRHRGSAPSALNRLAKQEGVELWKGPKTSAGATSTSS
jgi:predicted nucleotidyltransferase